MEVLIQFKRPPPLHAARHLSGMISKWNPAPDFLCPVIRETEGGMCDDNLASELQLMARATFSKNWHNLDEMVA